MKTAISIVVLIGLAAVAGSIIVGVRSFDGIVSEHPYETGLHWDETMRMKNKLGWSIELFSHELVSGDNDVSFTILDRQGKPVPAASVSLVISRPATTQYDTGYTVTALPDGRYHAFVHFPLFGYWDLTIQIRNGKDDMMMTERIYVRWKQDM